MGSIANTADERARSSVPRLNSTPTTISKTGPTPVGRFAWFVVAYNIAVILWGAYVRATGSGAGCGSHWPLCNEAILPATTRIQTVIEFTHRVTSAVSLLLVVLLLIWCRRRTVKGDWSRHSATAAAALLFNEALLGALLVLLDGMEGFDRSATHAVFLCLHFGNTLLLLAALALTAQWLSKRSRHFAVLATPYERIVIGLGLVSVMAIGTTGSLASLGDTIFPSDSLRHALMEDFSTSSHVLLRLRLLHPVAAVMGSMFLFWLLWRHWGKQDHSPWMFILAAALITQITLGAVNVILLAPIWLQMTHLLVAEIFWILLVLASAELLLSSNRGGLARGRTQVPQHESELLSLIAKNTTEQTNHLRERQVGRFGIETGPFIAREGVLGWIQERLIARTGASQRLIDRFASRIGNVRVLCSENHQEFTANFFCARQRSGICVLTELAIMNACPVVADRCTDIGLECSAEGEVAADAEAHSADFPWRDLGMFGEPVQTSPAIGIKMRNRSLRGVLLAARPSGVIKWDYRSGRFDAAIDFRRSGNKSVPGQTHTRS